MVYKTPGTIKACAARRKTIRELVKGMRTAQLRAEAENAPSPVKIEKRPPIIGIYKGGL